MYTMENMIIIFIVIINFIFNELEFIYVFNIDIHFNVN